jgi:hypothetical protein
LSFHSTIQALLEKTKKSETIAATIQKPMPHDNPLMPGTPCHRFCGRQALRPAPVFSLLTVFTVLLKCLLGQFQNTALYNLNPTDFLAKTLNVASKTATAPGLAWQRLVFPKQYKKGLTGHKNFRPGYHSLELFRPVARYVNKTGISSFLRLQEVFDPRSRRGRCFSLQDPDKQYHKRKMHCFCP